MLRANVCKVRMNNQTSLQWFCFDIFISLFHRLAIMRAQRQLAEEADVHVHVRRFQVINQAACALTSDICFQITCIFERQFGIELLFHCVRIESLVRTKGQVYIVLQIYTIYFLKGLFPQLNLCMSTGRSCIHQRKARLRRVCNDSLFDVSL